MFFSNLALSRRLERAEGNACAQFAEARRRLIPGCTSEWTECAGTYAVFDGVDSPVTQTFGLGIFEELKVESLERIELFFLDRDAPVCHEVSPFAGCGAIGLLCARGYQPIEISNVLYRAVEDCGLAKDTNVSAHVITSEEAPLWSQVNARGWGHERPELSDFLQQSSAVLAARGQSVSFLAEFEGQAGAAASLCIHNKVALFAGSATVPEFRRRGLQGALLAGRMRYALEDGCDLAMIVAEPGSNSHRNAERNGFQIAYTRMKWRLFR